MFGNVTKLKRVTFVIISIYLPIDACMVVAG
jgi:hypothetical protein